MLLTRFELWNVVNGSSLAPDAKSDADGVVM
jgi:hypothetical protein